MRLSLAAVALAVLTVSACAPLPEAPTELGELSLYLFSNFDDEDPLVMVAGTANLLAFLEDYEADVDLAPESEPQDRSWTVPLLEEGDWGGAPHWADANPWDQLPVALAVRSAYTGADHAPLVGMADQTPLESESSVSYDRTFDTDFDCWLAGDCDVVETTNEIYRNSSGVFETTYTAYKDFRWVELPDDAGTAVVARSWTTQRYDDVSAAHHQDFFSNMEVTIPSGNGTLRYNALWGAVVFEPAMDQETLERLVRNGLEEGFDNTEAHLAAR
jgi:hypothetical protein